MGASPLFGRWQHTGGRECDEGWWHGGGRGLNESEVGGEPSGRVSLSGGGRRKKLVDSGATPPFASCRAGGRTRRGPQQCTIRELMWHQACPVGDRPHLFRDLAFAVVGATPPDGTSIRPCWTTRSAWGRTGPGTGMSTRTVAERPRASLQRAGSSQPAREAVRLEGTAARSDCPTTTRCACSPPETGGAARACGVCATVGNRQDVQGRVLPTSPRHELPLTARHMSAVVDGLCSTARAVLDRRHTRRGA